LEARPLFSDARHRTYPQMKWAEPLHQTPQRASQPYPLPTPRKDLIPRRIQRSLPHVNPAVTPTARIAHTDFESHTLGQVFPRVPYFVAVRRQHPDEEEGTSEYNPALQKEHPWAQDISTPLVIESDDTSKDSSARIVVRCPPEMKLSERPVMKKV